MVTSNDTKDHAFHAAKICSSYSSRPSEKTYQDWGWCHKEKNTKKLKEQIIKTWRNIDDEREQRTQDTKKGRGAAAFLM